jgi:ATP-dependent RNA helicase RhlB
MSNTHLTDKRFTDFELQDSLLAGLSEAGFEFCTPIQAETLPHALAGKDVAGQAQTGTGKTMAFLLATYQKLLSEAPDPERKPNQPMALMLAPTRELAIQIEKDAAIIGKHSGLKLGLVYGGTGYDQQRRMLEQGVDILVGTPGRLIDYFKQGLYKLDHLKVLVLDEADRMFDMGFIKDIRYLLHRMPPPDQRLGLLFSATLSLRVAELGYEHLNEPVEIKIETENVTADKITEVVYHPSNEEKIPLLIGLLRRHEPRRTMIFINTKWVAEKIYAWLLGNGFRAGIISGDVPQKKRERLLQDFKDDKVDILVATDVAARGLHIPAVSHVFNYDLPQDAEDYVHRIGRTARAGATGDAISFACEDTAYNLMDIEEYIGHKIPLEQITPDLIVQPDPPARIESRRSAKPDDRKKRASGRGPDRKPARRAGDDRRSEPGKNETATGQQGKRTRGETIQIETPLSPSAEQDSGPQPRRGKKETPAIG